MLARIRAAVRSFFDLEDPDERIEGSGEVYLDPAYNGRYGAERELKRYRDLDETAGENVDDRRHD